MSAAPQLTPTSMSAGRLPSLSTLPATTKPHHHHHPFLALPSFKPLHLSLLSSPHTPIPPFLSIKKRLRSTPLVAEDLAWSEGQHPQAGSEEEPALSEWEAAAQEEAEEEESFPEPPEEAKLFVGNLPFNVDSEKLAQLFDQAGVVEVAEVIYNRDTDQSRGFGFVTMSTVEEAEKAVEMLHQYDVGGRLLTVNKAAPRGTSPERSQESEPSNKVYVGNLPWQVDEARLEQLFSEHGKVVDAKVVYDRETGRSRGFGFVGMASKGDMDDAIAALDGQSLDGRSLRVNAAEERSRRPSF